MRLKFILKFIGFFGLLSIPHILNKLGIQQSLFVTWDQIGKDFWANTSEYLFSLRNSFLRGIICVGISILLGVFFGVLFSYFEKWIGTFETVMKFIWSIPLIVVAIYLNIFISSVELFIIIIGVFLGAFPILGFTFKKCLEPNEGILSLVASFNLSKRKEYIHFRIKEVFRNLMYPLTQSVPLVYIGISMGEFTVGRAAGGSLYGLGSDFRNAINYSDFPKVYVTIILMVFLVFLSGEIFELLIEYKDYKFDFFKFFKKTRGKK